MSRLPTVPAEAPDAGPAMLSYKRVALSAFTREPFKTSKQALDRARELSGRSELLNPAVSVGNILVWREPAIQRFCENPLIFGLLAVNVTPGELHLPVVLYSMTDPTEPHRFPTLESALGSAAAEYKECGCFILNEAGTQELLSTRDVEIVLAYSS